MKKNMNKRTANEAELTNIRKKKSFLSLRWVVIIAASYMIIADRGYSVNPAIGIFLTIFIASNLLISRFPDRYFISSYFYPIVAVADIFLVSVAIYAFGRVTTDFFIIYFFIIMLSAIGESMKTVLMVASASALVYIAYLFKADALGVEIPIRIVFLYTAAMFNGFLVENLKAEKLKRHSLEEHLQLEEKLRRKEEQYCTLVQTVPDVIYSLSADGKILSLNPAFEKITGWQVDEILGKSFTELIHPDDLPSAGELFQHGVYDRQILPPVEFRIRSKSGEYLVGEFSSAPLIEHGKVIGEFGIARDISRYKKLEDMISKQLAAMEASMDGLAILDKDEKYVYLNDAHAKLYGYDSAKELIGQTWRVFYGEKEIVRFEQEVLPALWKNSQWRGETTGKRFDGSSLQQEVSLTLIDGGNIICVARDITELKCNVEMIKHMAYYDTLTGLPNRLLFNDRLGQSISEAQRQNNMLAIMFLDLDRFKTINDTLGHNIGDLLIQAVAQRLKGCMRKADTVTRLGGDEFLILFADLFHVQDAAVLAHKIISAFSKSFILDGRELHVTASVGISMYPADGKDVATLIKNADTSMYCAKEQGKNNYRFYSPAMNEKGLEHLTLQNNLHDALKQEELFLQYQPQFDLKTGRIVGVEALMRWQHPDFGLIAPAEFIPLAEENGVIIPIGEWLIYTACKQVKSWQEAGFSPGRVAVNLSMRQFQQVTLTEVITRILRETGLDPGILELELTESTVMQNPDMTIATLRELRIAGIHLSIDDFGTGYSSLNYLKHLPINRLKIAQNFASGITKDSNDEAISKAIITLAHSLNLRVVAEGVETIEQLEFFRLHNCDEVQGFLLSKPLSVNDMTQFLLEEHSIESASNQNSGIFVQ